MVYYVTCLLLITAKNYPLEATVLNKTDIQTILAKGH